jgi:DNA-binding NarL/FixJ family response regulator
MSRRARVLVIDDDPLFRSLIVSLLRKEFIVSVASEGSEGFYKALEHVPDIAIIDIKMPGWDGLKTLKAFRSHPLLAGVKAVILTADASKKTVLAAIQGGANDYIIKTAFSREDFHAKLEKLVRLSAAPTAAETAPATRRPRASRTRGAETPAKNGAQARRPRLSREEEDAALQELIDCWD